MADTPLARLESEVTARLADRRLMAVVTVKDAAQAAPLAAALQRGGIDTVEVTFRTPAAAQVIALIASELPGFMVAAGTVIEPAQADIAKAAGARFAVTPGLDEAVVRRCHEVGLPVFPGVLTPTEVQAALRLGCKTLKVFPIEPMGGVAVLKVLSGPYGPAGVRFMPTGGITVATMASYLEVPAVLSVGGTWIAPPDLVDAGAWGQIERRAAEAVSIAKASGRA